MENQIVIFELAEEHYGVDISAVESIVKMQPLTHVPHAPEFVEGITNLRGTVLPVIDLRKRFGLPAVEHDRESRIVVVNLSETKVGMIVDAVSEVLTIQEEAVEPPPAMVSSSNSAFLRGIYKMEDHLVILLNLERILSTEQAEIIQMLPDKV